MPETSALSVTAAPLASDVAARQPNVAVKAVQHSYGEGERKQQVLFNNNLEVAPGEIVIMTGQSGSGKTTLLTLIGTLRTVQEGSLRVLGQELHGAGAKEILSVRRKTGFIFQKHNLFGSLTALQNVRMALELFEKPNKDMDRRAAEMLTLLGLGNHIHKKPDQMSGGQQQRVAVARGLVHHPRLVLADEPTAALDQESARTVVSTFQKHASEGATILMVTHDSRVLDVADRIVNMDYGHIKSDVHVRESQVICEFLQKCDIFSHLSAGTLTEVADKMKAEKHPAGATIIKQGDAGDKFYLIRQGKVNVLRNGELIITLGEGNYFGEVALLEDSPRNASVVAIEDSVVYALGKEDFKAVISSSATFEEELRKALFSRH